MKKGILNPFSMASVLVFALEAEGGGLLGDDALEVGDFFGVEAVIDGLQFFLSALDGVFGGLFVDFIFTEGHVGEDDGFVVADFREAGTDGKGEDLALVLVAELSWLKCGHKTRVAGKDTQFAIRAWQIDVIHGVGENLFLRGDDFEVERHGGKC